MNEPGIDLTGKLIIKVALGDDIRRILITNEDITYDELVLMMQRVYRGKLNSTDDIVIKYKDEDNDLITIFDSSDLSFAIQCSRILKITLFVNSKPEPLQTDEIKMIKTELKHIRDRCTKLLDRLDDREVQEIPSSSVDSTTNKGNITDSPRRQAAPSPRMPVPTNAAGGKEFDPLSRQRSMDDHQEKVMSSFGIANDVDRAGTPDSISSIGSAGQRQAGQITPQLPPQSTPQAPPQGTPQAPPQQPQQPKQPQQPATPSGMYGGPSAGQKMSPWQQQNQPLNATGQPSSYPGQQQQQQGYPGSTPQQGYPGQTPQTPASQPTSLPTSASGPSYGPGGAPYSSYSQPGQVMGMYGQQQPGQYQGQQPGQPGQPGPQGQTGHPSQLPGQQQQQQQPTPQSYYQPQQPGAPGQVPPPGPGSNPYARQGPGYSSGYPRPVASYPQGYQ